MRGARKISNRRDLETALQDDPELLVQEHVDWTEYTVDTFCDFAGTPLSVVPRERIRVWGGESFIGKTVRNQLIMDEAGRLAVELGLVGHNTIQVFRKDSAVSFIEVNPRFGGGANLSFEAGAFTPEMLIRLVRGENVSPILGLFRENLVMLRYTEDYCLDAREVARQR